MLSALGIGKRHVLENNRERLRRQVLSAAGYLRIGVGHLPNPTSRGESIVQVGREIFHPATHFPRTHYRKGGGQGSGNRGQIGWRRHSHPDDRQRCEVHPTLAQRPAQSLQRSQRARAGSHNRHIALKLSNARPLQTVASHLTNPVHRVGHRLGNLPLSFPHCIRRLVAFPAP